MLLRQDKSHLCYGQITASVGLSLGEDCGGGPQRADIGGLNTAKHLPSTEMSDVSCHSCASSVGR